MFEKVKAIVEQTVEMKFIVNSHYSYDINRLFNII